MIVFVFVALLHFGLLSVNFFKNPAIKTDPSRKKRKLTILLVAKKAKLPKGSGLGFGHGKGPILKPGGMPDPQLIQQSEKTTPLKKEKPKSVPPKTKSKRKRIAVKRSLKKKTKTVKKKSQKELKPLEGAKVVSNEPVLIEKKDTSAPPDQKSVLNEGPESAARGEEKEYGEGKPAYGAGGGSGIGTGYGIGGGEGIGKGESYEAIDIKSAYLSYIRNRIEKFKYYPEQARRRGFKGSVWVAFIINKDGTVSQLRIHKASEYSILNDAALETIKRIAKFHPLPDELEVDELEVIVPLRYAIIDTKG